MRPVPSILTRWGRAVILLTGLGITYAAVPTVLSAQRDVSWTITAPDSILAGERFEIVFEASMDPGWHLYAIDSPAGRPLRIVTDSLPEGISVGDPTQSGPIEGYDPFFDATVRYYELNAEFRLPLVVAATVEQGIFSIAGKVEYMYCDDRVCIPTSEQFVNDVEVVGIVEGEPAEPLSQSDPATPGQATAGGSTSPESAATQSSSAAISVATRDLDKARSGGFLGFLIIAMGAGLAALLTPCVFPMIPLTISFFSSQAENRRQAIRMALVFGLSIVLIFTGLGVAMAFLLGAAGAQLIATNPWVNLGIGTVFVVFALSLLGLFELRLPHRFVNYVNKQGNTKGGIIGVIFMGFTLTLVSFSCTAPFVGGLLAATAGNEWTWPILGMLAFSTTFALPFVLFALFPNWLASLPKSGAWMNVVKVTLGFVELAAAFKFLSNADLVWGWGVLSRTLVIAAWIVIFLLTGFYLLGKLRLIDDEPVEGIGTVRLLFAIGFLGLGVYMFPGLLGAPLNNIDAYLPPRQATDVSLASLVARATPGESLDGLSWRGNDEQPYEEAISDAFAESKISGRPVLIDFTGYTCTNCRQMEANVFPNPAVSDRLRSDFILLRLYTDDATDGPELQRYQLQLTGTVALPTYAIVDSEGTLLARWQGMASVEEFAAFLAESTPVLRPAS